MKLNGFISVLFCKLVLIINLINGKLSNEKDKHVRAVDLQAVEGRSLVMPCPISSPIRDVYMVLWFKNNEGIPLYSFDVRDETSLTPKHWSAPEVFGSRAKFNIDSMPASLVIKDIKRHDQGIYRCRIDFRTSQTQSFRYNLSIIILPEQPVVLDRWGRMLNSSVLGPKQEGDDIMITCRVVGGRPQPEVRWLINGELVDDQYEHNSGDVIENRLLWPSIQRNNLNSIYTCQATNTDLVDAKESSFVLDMNLKPLTVKIMNPISPLVADRRYEISCESTGSRPNAIITWYKGKRQLRRTKDDIMNNTTISELSFIPSTDDDGKMLTCRGENPTVNGLFLETSLKLDVVYPPLVTLHLGSTLAGDDIKEGDDVYFECHVQANPQWKKLIWLHNGIHLTHNATARIIRSNQSLVLQKVAKHSAGNYACSAINAEGETVSNELPLRVKYSPICVTEKVVLIGAAKDENVKILCEINADPPARAYRWRFNNSGETLDVGAERYTVNGTQSVLHYTPVTDQDYGTLSCWGVNDVGAQRHPCLFQVILAGLPSPVSNCTLNNQTQQFVEIQCIAGYDGGLPQMFILELISKRTGIIRYNFSNQDEPYFVLESIDELNHLMAMENNSLTAIIYSINQKGRSQGVIVRDLEIGRTLRHTAANTSYDLSPVLIGIIITILFLLIFIILKLYIASLIKKYRKANNDLKISQQTNNLLIISSNNKDDIVKMNGNQKQLWQHIDANNTTAPSTIITPTITSASRIKTSSDGNGMDDERDPDVIPQYVDTTTSTVVTPDFYAQTQYPVIQETNSPHLFIKSSSVYYNNTASNNVRNHLFTSTIPSHSSRDYLTTSATTNRLGGLGGLVGASASSSTPSSSSIISSTMPRTKHTAGNGSDMDININMIKDCLMTTRVPESCV